MMRRRTAWLVLLGPLAAVACVVFILGGQEAAHMAAQAQQAPLFKSSSAIVSLPE